VGLNHWAGTDEIHRLRKFDCFEHTFSAACFYADLSHEKLMTSHVPATQLWHGRFAVAAVLHRIRYTWAKVECSCRVILARESGLRI